MENSQEFFKTVELYEAPDIEVTDIETEQNILGGSGEPADFGDGGQY